MSQNQDIILQQVNQSIRELSHKIKEKHPDLSWQIEFEQDATDHTENEQLFKINVSFSNKDSSLLELSFLLDGNQNLSIDGGLVDDEKLLVLLNKRNGNQKLIETVKGYLINSKDIMYYSTARLRSFIPSSPTNMGTVKKSLGNIMMQIEVVFLALMYEVQLKEI